MRAVSLVLLALCACAHARVFRVPDVSHIKLTKPSLDLASAQRHTSASFATTLGEAPRTDKGSGSGAQLQSQGQCPNFDINDPETFKPVLLDDPAVLFDPNSNWCRVASTSPGRSGLVGFGCGNQALQTQCSNALLGFPACLAGPTTPGCPNFIPSQCFLPCCQIQIVCRLCIISQPLVEGVRPGLCPLCRSAFACPTTLPFTEPEGAADNPGEDYVEDYALGVSWTYQTAYITVKPTAALPDPKPLYVVYTNFRNTRMPGVETFPWTIGFSQLSITDTNQGKHISANILGGQFNVAGVPGAFGAPAFVAEANVFAADGSTQYTATVNETYAFTDLGLNTARFASVGSAPDNTRVLGTPGAKWSFKGDFTSGFFPIPFDPNRVQFDFTAVDKKGRTTMVNEDGLHNEGFLPSSINIYLSNSKMEQDQDSTGSISVGTQTYEIESAEVWMDRQGLSQGGEQNIAACPGNGIDCIPTPVPDGLQIKGQLGWGWTHATFPLADVEVLFYWGRANDRIGKTTGPLPFATVIVGGGPRGRGRGRGRRSPKIVKRYIANPSLNPPVIEFAFDDKEHVRAPETQNWYPMKRRLRIPELGFDVTCENVRNSSGGYILQEIQLPSSSASRGELDGYYEGLAVCQGVMKRVNPNGRIVGQPRPISGHGVLERVNPFNGEEQPPDEDTVCDEHSCAPPAASASSIVAATTTSTTGNVLAVGVMVGFVAGLVVMGVVTAMRRRRQRLTSQLARAHEQSMSAGTLAGEDLDDIELSTTAP